MTELFFATGAREALGLIEGIGFVVAGACLIAAAVTAIVAYHKRKDK